MAHVIGNAGIELQVLPELGGRIDQITDTTSGKDWLWHPKGYRPLPRSLAIGESFDENWSGGWDEMFPNDAAGEFRGAMLPDHGELWSQAWNVIESSPQGIKMRYRCKTIAVEVEKTVVISAEGRPEFQVDYLFKSSETRALPFLFKLHPALAIEAGDRVVLPECSIEPVDLGFSGRIGRPGRTPFPRAVAADGSEVRLDEILPLEARTREFVYATGLKEGRAGLHNRRTGTTLSFHFNPSDLPAVWLFQSLGGWNGHYVTMIEPCTNVPYDLEQAIARGTCAKLEPFGERRISVRVMIERPL